MIAVLLQANVALKHFTARLSKTCVREQLIRKNGVENGVCTLCSNLGNKFMLGLKFDYLFPFEK